MIKVAINRCFGGFALSTKACEFLGLSPDDAYEFSDNTRRTDPNLIRCIETLGKDASDEMADIHIVQIPDGVPWHIADYDGCEHVAENHRTWR